MNKAQLIQALQEDKDSGLESKAAAERALNSFIDTIKKTLKKNDNVQLVGFGTFAVKERKARKGRNPQTGEEIKIPKQKTVSFRPGKTLKDMLNPSRKKK